MVTVNISIEQLPRALKNFGDQIPFAASNALNDVAFGAKRFIQDDLLPNNLTLRNQHMRRGIRVEKSTKNTLRAEFGSVDYYSERLVEGSLERPKRGFLVDGVRYFLIPNPKRVGKNGNLKKLPRNTTVPFAIKSKKGKRVLVVRKKIKRRHNNLILLGLLVTRKQYLQKVPWDREVDQFIQREWPRAFTKNMVKAARTAR